MKIHSILFWPLWVIGSVPALITWTYGEIGFVTNVSHAGLIWVVGFIGLIVSGVSLGLKISGEI